LQSPPPSRRCRREADCQRRSTQPPALPEVRLSAVLTLSVQLYEQQAIDYAVAKLADGAAAVTTEIASLGADTPVIAALTFAQGAELASKTAQYLELVRRIARELNLNVQRFRLVTPIVRLVRDKIGALAGEVLARVASTLAGALASVGEEVRKRVEDVFRHPQWLVELGGETLRGAGHIVASGWYFSRGVFGGGGATEANERFDASEPRQLDVTALQSSHALGFGPQALLRQAALLAARALVKYELGLVTVRPLLVSSFSPEPRQVLCLAGGSLSGDGIADIELTGPGFRGLRLVRTRSSVAGGCLRLPSQMAPGEWRVALVDYHDYAMQPGVLVDVFPFTVPLQRRTGGTAAATWILIGLGVAALLLLVALARFGALAALWRRAPVLGARIPVVRFLPRPGSGSVAPLMKWGTKDLVVLSLGVALAVFFAGVTAAVAAGQTPPTALWAAGSAVSGGLLGLLAPSPGSRRRQMQAAAEADERAATATVQEQTHITAALAAPGPDKAEHEAKPGSTAGFGCSVRL
jgi:hypothetical protein